MSTNMSRRRWTEPAIEEQLLALSAKLGRFPDRKDLVAEGLRGLWDAMQRGDGVEAWRKRLTGAQQPAAIDPVSDQADSEPVSDRPVPDQTEAEAVTDQTEAEAVTDQTEAEAVTDQTEAEPVTDQTEAEAVTDHADSEPISDKTDSELAATGQAPTAEQIAELAYRLHEDGVEGDHLSHWLAAERRLVGS